MTSSMGSGWHPIYEIENNPFMFQSTNQLYNRSLFKESMVNFPLGTPDLWTMSCYVVAWRMKDLPNRDGALGSVTGYDD